ncbi:MAG: DUF2933 domain-containing protein [Anaerolineales bacterium]|nr:MAG: DUF2933 domain-containing protein [Anaerolineales bacterium]
MKDSGKFRFGEWLRSSTGLVFVTFLVIAAFFLFTEHKAHLYGILPYALLTLSLLLYWLIRRRQEKD